MIIYTVTWHDYDRTKIEGTFSDIEEACRYLGATMEDLDLESDNAKSKIRVFGYRQYTITATVLDNLLPPDNTGCCDVNDSDEITEDCCDSFFQ